MPLFAVICRDRPGALQTRIDNRADHRGWLTAAGNVRMAGPLLTDGAMCGSLIVVEADSLAAAEAWAAADPYRAAGLFETVEVVEWQQVI